MSGIYKGKKTALDWITANQERLSDFHQLIWKYAEPAWREYRSAKAYCDLLREEGFNVVEGTGGMPTAFMATFGSGKPVLASYAEYDAVPENNQAAVPYRKLRDECLHDDAPGHTDPHSGLGVGALTGVLAAKAAMEKHHMTGTLKFFGEPAEKVCGSKPVHAAKGYFDDLDAAISFHPGGSNTALWETATGAYWSAVFTFECLEPEKWFKPVFSGRIGGHAGGRCPAAIDAVCLMYTTTKYSKEAMLPHAAYWTLNEFIMVGGQCTADNRPPRISQIQYAWRVPSLAMAQHVYDILESNAKHVAELTFCKTSVRWITKTRVALPNHAMAETTYKNFQLVGPPTYEEEAEKVGREIQRNLGFEPMDKPFMDQCEMLTSPQEHEEEQRKTLEPWQWHRGADDYVDYSWHAPTVRLTVARATLKRPRPDYTYPWWTGVAMGGIRSTIDPMIFTAGKVVGATLVDLFTKPEDLVRAQLEFKERTGGGVGGSKWVAPLLSRDFEPPVDLRWPEYVTTVRGEEWWIPTTKSKEPRTEQEDL